MDEREGNMETYVFDNNRQLIGVVESFQYFRWTRRYSRPGSFELKAIGSTDNANLLKIGNYIWKSDDTELGMIERIELNQDEKETITASGRFATALLDRRIVWGTEVLNGDISPCIGQLIANHLINPSEADRAITYVAFGVTALGINVKTQVSYKNLLDTVTELCDATDVGIRTTFTPKTGVLVMNLYQGGATQAVFAREYENLISQNFIQSVTDYADTALIGGQGEGADRVLATINGASGEERREIFIDARDLNADDFGADYESALVYRGQTKIAEHAEVNVLDAEINSRGNLVYKTDYDLGDIVTVHARRWGVSMNVRITEITESYDESGLALDVVFGRGLLTLAQKFKEGY
jgi:hypothetical protein